MALSSKLNIERVVALLTPAFAAAAGWLTTVIGNNIPGVAIPKGDLVALFVAGATAAAAAALKWLHGRQKLVTWTDDTERRIAEIVHSVSGNKYAGPALHDIESVLQQHEDTIIKAVENAVHMPPTVDEIINAMMKRIGGTAAGVPAASAQQVGTGLHS